MSSTSYDQLPYKTLPNRDSNPSRLGAIARIHGIDAASIGACSVLEIGCGTGGNIFPLAERYPESRFVGIDLSGRQIRDAAARAEELGLKNSEFIAIDVQEFSCKPGEFDYVMCHGVYSWVPEPVQAQILRLIGHALSPQGMAYVSYNVLPGWRQRGVVRDVLTFGASLSGSDAPETRVEAALEFLAITAASRGTANDPYSAYLREACERLQGKELSYIAHEYLEECNAPCTFTQFMEAAHRVGLQFVIEAKPVFMSTSEIGSEAEAFLSQIGDDIIVREQALDIFRNRMFRETLLCHAGLPIKRDLKASAFREVVFVADYAPTADEAAQSVTFVEIASGRTIQLPRGSHAEVLRVVSRAGAAGVKMSSIGSALTGVVSDERELMATLAALWNSGFIGIEQLPVPAATVPSGQAHLSKLVQLQVARGEPLSTLRHMAYDPTSSERELLSRVDGSKTFESLISGSNNEAYAREALEGLVQRGVFVA